MVRLFGVILIMVMCSGCAGSYKWRQLEYDQEIQMRRLDIEMMKIEAEKVAQERELLVYKDVMGEKAGIERGKLDVEMMKVEADKLAKEKELMVYKDMFGAKLSLERSKLEIEKEKVGIEREKINNENRSLFD